MHAIFEYFRMKQTETYLAIPSIISYEHPTDDIKLFNLRLLAFDMPVIRIYIHLF